MRSHEGRRGQTLIQAIGVTIVIAVAALAITNLITMLNKADLGSKVVSTSADLKKLITSNIEDDEAWQKIIVAPENAANLNCLVDLTDAVTCNDNSASAGIPIALYDRKGNLVYDGTVATNGLTINGAACAGFSPSG